MKLSLNHNKCFKSKEGSCLIELHYFPCLEYFAAISSFEYVIIEAHENFNKQTYRNRCYIRTANKIKNLSVPTKHNDGKKIKIKDVEIDYNQKWLQSHWRTIKSAYGNAPFFDFFWEEFHKILFRRPKFLYDLNYEILTVCLNLLNLDINVKFSERYIKEPKNEIQDFRSLIYPKKRSDNTNFYYPVEYQQVFGKKFVENLSIVDLLFCEGPQAGYILNQSLINNKDNTGNITSQNSV